LSSKLKRTYDTLVYDTRLKREIDKNEKNFRNIVTDSRLRNSTLFLNTDIVKTSLILSQLRSYDIYPKVVFSTQLNYDPLLMTLTQDKDRDRLIVANSIDVVDKELRDDIANLGGNIVYEWVDYSTLVGINYLYYGQNSSLVPTKIENNQAIYTPRLFKSTEYGFSEIK
jgi:SRSO17 transposase